ncbi:hypothetical protein [Nocardioides alkalitolerans]|uniref:hypothetical protein n=1 Tax=Nocardioides alkalitolerans TaxID=281714 RepID=UPI000413487E|nr:hypothetical protein [Nocardioides alkalitolerans]
MAECRGCGGALTGRHQKSFCSNGCQRQADRRLRTEAWLASGVAFIDTNPRHYVRLHLMEEQAGRCALCRGEATWNGRPLTLVLDHVDGDANHNARGNLRLVCPNCDSQLPTYKARNRGRGRAWRRERYARGDSY